MTKVYEDFDQETLDNEYLISRTVPSLEPFIADYGNSAPRGGTTSIAV